MRMSQYRHQPRNQPARHDANLLDEAFFHPEQQIVGFL
jgi:hypothetical protein